MLENEIVLNQAQLSTLGKIARDLPAERHFTAGAGHGHSPAWLIGHLAIVGEMGCTLLGASLKHPGWLPDFSPGSAGIVDASDEYAPQILVDALNAAYQDLQQLAATADSERLKQPHGIELLSATPIRTVAHAIALVLTNHFGFHTAQLSSCRRQAGFAPLI